MGNISERDTERNQLTRARGLHAEQLACRYLEKKGFRLVEKNYRLKCGEIDLIMQNNAILIFVEVRYRKNNFYGGAAASVTWRKQQRLIRAAHYFSVNKTIAKQLPSRFDVVTLSGDLNSPTISWIQDAFRVEQ